ncbi:MAG TPA: ATP-binding protein, partial [Solirubrobacterales bacterium]|nr:ATP-binding protein [Solirubrobacterales bacterium]
HRAGADAQALERASRDLVLAPDVGLAGRVRYLGRAFWTDALPENEPAARREAFAAMRLQTALGVPIRHGEQLIGVMTFFSRDRRVANDDLSTTMEDIGSRVGSYIEQKRLQDELARQREALHHSERLASLGTLTAGLAHELNNPLGIVSSRVEIMLMEATEHQLPAAVVEDLKVIHRNLQRVARLAQALRAFGRQSSREHVAVEINKVVEETLLLMQKTLAADNIRIDVTLAPALPVIGADAIALQQVMLNLITNAREAMGQGGVIRIETAAVPGPPAGVRVSVADDGPGIPPEHRPRIFDPFYTTKPDGTGLGLSVSYGIVKEHGGSIEVDSAAGRGTTFILEFPALDSRVA